MTIATSKYFKFLCSLIGNREEFKHLLEKLHSIEFYSIIPNDDNRVQDGYNLRDVFADEGGPTGPLSLAGIPDFECSVLEMLIALSERLEFETAQSKWEKTVEEWFWILIDNLGFLTCTDQAFLQCRTLDKYVDQTISIFLERGYSPDGQGGLFPLKTPEKDQRRVEIWYQMNSYVMENYPI